MEHLRQLIGLVFVVTLIAAGPGRAAENRILVYTRNGPTWDGKKGFTHDNIAACVAVLRRLGKANNIAVDVAADPVVFTAKNLRRYGALVFANANNQAFATEQQRAAFTNYIHQGGGYVGIHSSTGCERNWPWFWAMQGGAFWFHAPLQRFTIQITDKRHPATSFFTTDTWEWEDEFYVMKEQPKNVRVLLAGNIQRLHLPETTRTHLPGLPASIPLAWCHEFEGGRVFYTSLGHKKEYYSDPNLQRHILGGILWAMGQDIKKAK
jgi:type 1 glutamine amidotransferase